MKYLIISLLFLSFSYSQCVEFIKKESGSYIFLKTFFDEKEIKFSGGVKRDLRYLDFFELAFMLDELISILKEKKYQRIWLKKGSFEGGIYQDFFIKHLKKKYPNHSITKFILKNLNKVVKRRTLFKDKLDLIAKDYEKEGESMNFASESLYPLLVINPCLVINFSRKNKTIHDMLQMYPSLIKNNVEMLGTDISHRSSLELSRLYFLEKTHFTTDSLLRPIVNQLRVRSFITFDTNDGIPEEED